MKVMKFHLYGLLALFFLCIPNTSYAASMLGAITVSQANMVQNNSKILYKFLVHSLYAWCRSVLPTLGLGTIGIGCGALVYGDENVDEGKKKIVSLMGASVFSVMLSTLISLPLPDKHKIVPYALICPLVGALVGGLAFEKSGKGAAKGAAVTTAALVGYLAGVWGNVMITGR